MRDSATKYKVGRHPPHASTHTSYQCTHMNMTHTCITSKREGSMEITVHRMSFAEILATAVFPAPCWVSGTGPCLIAVKFSKQELIPIRRQYLDPVQNSDTHSVQSHWRCQRYFISWISFLMMHPTVPSILLPQIDIT